MTTPVPGQEDFDQQGRTFRLEILRALPAGFIDTAATTFALFIAIRVFDLPPAMKAAMLSAGSVGLLFSLFIVQIARRLGRPVNALAALIWVLSFIGFGIAALSEGKAAQYFTGCFLAFTALGMSAPLTSQIYRKHYSNHSRGRLFSFTAMIRASTAGLVAWLAGVWIGSRGNEFSPLFWSYGIACLIMAGCVLAVAPVVLRRTIRLQWFEAFRHVGNDPPFRKLLKVWMIFGLGNLLSFALFVEYISNPAYGFAYDAKTVGIITSTVPMIAFIACVVPWGIVFDRLPFYSVRALVNVFFILSILMYFLGNGFFTLCLGIALHGVARSGGNILWTLWVTRFADSERVVEYMSVHSFLTGARGVLAPFIAYAIASYASPIWVAGISASLIFVSTLAITPEICREFRERRANN
ncbi:MAG: MFS transporter [Akkermansiaceae bacterium]|jgi:MFS family permease|nr:MFS transporter [Akkermansiaceae bacterium]MDP4647248.1 MFS transporter [Akkermansiaceae bacterium]MDP4722526.1 MFS transporter [Akkermansiaceae bacterium]MDP4781028.1 MFS transporter [Akkermansiaceae bacterium]MDP4848539.1 MFS transporter [Akkermansiaceae bacterium]